MEKTLKTRKGGGANKAFSPLVASSLALALGMSVAVAQVSTDDPVIKAGSQTITLEDVTWDKTSNVLTPQVSSQIAENITFTFYGQDISADHKAKRKTIQTKDGQPQKENIWELGNTNTFSITAKEKVKMGASGAGTLSTNWAKLQANRSPKATYIFEKGFEGNITTLGGSWLEGELTGEFDITFGKAQAHQRTPAESTENLGLKGNLTAKGYDNTFLNNITITFEQGYLEGNLDINSTQDFGQGGRRKKTATVTFNPNSDNKITGELKSGHGTATTINFHDQKIASIGNGVWAEKGGSNTIVFKSASGDSITGNITAKDQGANTITFQGKGIITGKIFHDGNGANNSGFLYNTITFEKGGEIKKNDSDATVIETRGSLSGDVWGGTSRNLITFKGSSDASATITGDIVSGNGRGNNGNIINFEGTGTNTITGAIKANGGDNKITFKNAIGTITGNISANGDGSNSIVLSGTSTQGQLRGASSGTPTQSSITGNITAEEKSANTITFKDFGTITGKILHDGNGANNSGFLYNTITFENGGSITKASDADGIAIETKLTHNRNWAHTSKNLITFKGSRDATITGDIVSGNGKGNNGNIINFEGSGANKIAGTIKANGGDNTITVQGSAAALTVTGSLSASNGTNNLRANVSGGTLAIASGTITASGGSNILTAKSSITIANTSADSPLITTTGGANTITSEAITINASASNATAIKTSGGTTTITAGIGTITGNVTTTGGNTKISFDNTGANQTLRGERNVSSSITGIVTTSGGTTTISGKTITLQSSEDNDSPVKDLLVASTSGGASATNSISIQEEGSLTIKGNIKATSGGWGITHNNITGQDKSSINIQGSIKANSTGYGINGYDRSNNLHIKATTNGSGVQNTISALSLDANSDALKVANNHVQTNRLIIGAISDSTAITNLNAGNLASNITSLKGKITIGSGGSSDVISANTGSENLLSAEKINVKGNIKAQDRGANAFTFKEGIFQGTITVSNNNSRNIFNIISSDSKMGKDASSDITFSGSNGTHIINLNGDDTSLTLMKTDSAKTSFANAVRGSETNLVGLKNNSKAEINFNATGTKLTLTTLTTQANATTTINVADGVKGVFAGQITTEATGTTTIAFGADKADAREATTPTTTYLKIDKKPASNGTHTISSITLGGAHTKASTGNILDLTNAGALSVTSKLTVGTTDNTKAQDLTVKLSDTTLTLAGGFETKAQGTFNLDLVGGTNTVKGNATEVQFVGGSNNINFLASSETASNAITLKWTKNDDTVKNITTTAGTTNINLANGVDAKIAGGITTNNGGKTNIIFGADSTPSENTEATRQPKTTKLALGKVTDDNTGSSITNIKFAESGNSTDNTLDLTGVSKLSVTDKVSVGTTTQTQGLTIELKDTELTLQGGLDTNENGTTALRVNATTSNANATLKGSSPISLTSLNLVGTASNTSKLTIQANDVNVATLTAQEGTPTLVLDASNNKVVTTIENKIEEEVLVVNLKSADDTKSSTLNLNGGTIKTLSVTGTNNNLTLNSGVTTITDALAGHENSKKALNVTLQDNTTLALGGEANTITTLTGAKGSRVDLARVENDGSTPLKPRNTGTYKKLTIGANTNAGFKGQAEFEVYVGADKKADSIVFESATKQDDDSKSVATITASGDQNTIKNGDGTIVLATVQNGAKDKMEVQGGTKRFGAIDVTTVLTTDDGITYKLGKGLVRIDDSFQDIASTALIVNYDLYVANFNSLNKRMGELRDNPNSQGVWTRVFGGAMSSDYGSGSKTNYLTTQAGYDYSFGFSGARNYLGVALAYGKSWTKGNTLQANNFNGTTSAISLSSVDSSLVEVGVYNSYVSDSGWYNDTILKFDYIMSEFSLSDDTALKTDTNNFAVVLSNEVGYRYEFGGSKDWYIDPQLELAFGYFNQSNFNRMIEGNDIKGTQDTILTLRSRIGSALGKKFEGEKGSASLYVGAFYEFDYIVGGDASAGTTDVLNPLSSKLVSNGRAIVNVGSNIALGEATRLYIDVEKSFGEEQRTFMQFNAGVRYSFGESNGYTPQEKKNTASAPLKIEKK